MLYAFRMSLRATQLRLEQKQSCRFSNVYEAFDKDDKAVVDSWVNEQKPSGWIARVISADGVAINEKTVKKHLDGACCCPSENQLRGAYRVSA